MLFSKTLSAVDFQDITPIISSGDASGASTVESVFTSDRFESGDIIVAASILPGNNCADLATNLNISFEIDGSPQAVADLNKATATTGAGGDDDYSVMIGWYRLTTSPTTISVISEALAINQFVNALIYIPAEFESGASTLKDSESQAFDNTASVSTLLSSDVGSVLLTVAVANDATNSNLEFVRNGDTQIAGVRLFSPVGSLATDGYGLIYAQQDAGDGGGERSRLERTDGIDRSMAIAAYSFQN